MGQLARRRKRYPYKDYLKWPEDESWEIIDGIAYNMTPAPKVKHQNIAGNFYIKIKSHPNNGNTDLILYQFNRYNSIPFPPFYFGPQILFPKYL
jgi:hypothetical protein